MLDSITQSLKAILVRDIISIQPIHSVSLKRTLTKLMLMVPLKDLRKLKKKRIQFLPTNPTLASSIDTGEDSAVVLLYPDLEELLDQCEPLGMAVLAHELGHIVKDHSAQNKALLEAQMEADHYACLLGFKKEIAHIVGKLATGEEKLVRLQAMGADLGLEQKS